MSKSKGNGIDPLEMIKKYGADALRLSLVMDVAPGQDSRVYEEKIEGFRNFVTKLWNIFRYAQTDKDLKLVEKINKKDPRTLADRWIINELEETKAAVGALMDARNISLAQARLRKFTWDQLADWYLEIHKMEKNSKVLGHVLHELLKMWHPFMPFVTEELWRLYGADGKILMAAKWPAADKGLKNKKAVENFNALQGLIGKIRNARSSYHINPAQLIDAYSKDIAEKEIVAKLARVRFVAEKKKDKLLPLVSHGSRIQLDIAKLVDVKKELRALEKETQELEKLIAKNEALLKNEKFVRGARTEIVEATKIRTEEYRIKLKGHQEAEKSLKSLL